MVSIAPQGTVDDVRRTVVYDSIVVRLNNASVGTAEGGSAEGGSAEGGSKAMLSSLSMSNCSCKWKKDKKKQKKKRRRHSSVSSSPGSKLARCADRWSESTGWEGGRELPLLLLGVMLWCGLVRATS